MDGTSGARFSDLKGLAIGRPMDGILTNVLYVVDGHSVRRVSLDGSVATLCGDPAVAGTPGPGAVRLPLAGVPCLDRPHGIAVLWPRILIADRGNHAIQILRYDIGGRMELSTLAGGGEAATRFGLLRDGIRGPLGPEYGALADPMGLAADPWGDLYIADGRCVVQASEPLPPAGLAGPKLELSPGGGVHSDLTLEVAFTGPRVMGDPEDVLDSPPHFFWRLDCIHAASGGPAAAPATGEVRGRPRGSARVTFEQKGEADVILTCVTPNGHSTQDAVRIRVD
jgi:hypothetical protein